LVFSRSVITDAAPGKVEIDEMQKGVRTQHDQVLVGTPSSGSALTRFAVEAGWPVNLHWFTLTQARPVPASISYKQLRI
jgi:hypothetical protein